MFENYVTWNNIISKLTSAISSQTWVIIVDNGAIFPSTFPYLITVEQKQGESTVVREIMKATAKSDNVITVERAVESCISDDTESPKTLQQVAHNFNAWSLVSIQMTAGTLKDLQDELVAQSGRIWDAENEIEDLNDLIVQLENDIADL